MFISKSEEAIKTLCRAPSRNASLRLRARIALRNWEGGGRGVVVVGRRKKKGKLRIGFTDGKSNYNFSFFFLLTKKILHHRRHKHDYYVEKILMTHLPLFKACIITYKSDLDWEMRGMRRREKKERKRQKKKNLNLIWQ